MRKCSALLAFSLAAFASQAGGAEGVTREVKLRLVPNAQPGAVNISVTLVVNALEAEIFLHTGDESTPAPPMDFICVEGGTDPTPGSFWVMNAGELGSVLQWSAVDDLTGPDWLVARASKHSCATSSASAVFLRIRQQVQYTMAP